MKLADLFLCVFVEQRLTPSMGLIDNRVFILEVAFLFFYFMSSFGGWAKGVAAPSKQQMEIKGSQRTPENHYMNTVFAG